MHKIEKRPSSWTTRSWSVPMMYLALSYDHRLIDGEQAVTFLVRVKERLGSRSACCVVGPFAAIHGANKWRARHET